MPFQTLFANTSKKNIASRPMLIELHQEQNTFDFTDCSWESYKKARAVEERIVSGLPLKPQLLIYTSAIKQTCERDSQFAIEQKFHFFYQRYLELLTLTIGLPSNEEEQEEKREQVKLQLKEIDRLFYTDFPHSKTMPKLLLAEAYALHSYAHFNAIPYVETLTALGYLQQATQSFELAILLDKENTRAQLLQLYSQAIDPPGKNYQTKTIAGFKKLIENNRKKIEIFNSHLMLSQLYIKNFDSKKAIFHTNLAMEIYPKNPILMKIIELAGKLKTAL